MEVKDLLDSVDIVDYISQFVDLEEKNGEFWGLSPFREEKTPSFSVRRETGKFFDFSSGIGGTLICFIKNYFHCGGAEAVKRLSEYAGIDSKSITATSKLLATTVCKKFKLTRSTEKAISHKFFDEKCMERYEKCEEKLAVWRREGISRQSLDKFQVYYDRFSDRLVYPIRDLSGRIVNIGGRTLDPSWKEKKLRKYTYFSGWGGGMSVVYGLFENLEAIKRRKEVIIFEGCKSVLMADTWGIHNCGALLTSHLSAAQLKILAKLGVRVVFALDKDVRVRDDHNISKLKQFVNVEYIHDFTDALEDKDSPVDRGFLIFEQLYNNRLKLK